jgi:DNA-binding transcriptional LysR family regulator
MNNISIKHLRAFVSIANAGSFTRAAAQLNLTQSTLTASIKLLEQQAGLILLDRTTRQVTLTKEGERFFPVARRLINDFRLAMDDLQAGAEQQRGHISIATSPTANSFLIPELVCSYHQQYPNINLSIYESGASEIEQQVASKFADFGLGSNHSQHPELNYQLILQDQYGVVSTPDHPIAQQQTLKWQDLPNFKLLHLSENNGIRAELERWHQQSIIQYPKPLPVIEASNPNGLAALIDNQLGISVLPALAAQVNAFQGLTFTLLTHPIRSRALYIVTRLDGTLSPSAQSILERLQGILQQRATQAQTLVEYHHSPIDTSMTGGLSG